MATVTVLAGQSIQAAINAAATGDIIEVQTGTFNEQLTITGKAVTVRAATGHTPLLRGASAADYIIRIGTSSNGSVLSGLTISLNPGHADPGGGNQRWEWIDVWGPNSVLQDLTMYQDGVNTHADALAARVAGKRYKAIGITSGGHNTQVLNCDITGVAQGVHVGPVQNTLIRGNDIHNTQQSCIVLANTSDANVGTLIEDNILRDSAIEDGIQFVTDFGDPNMETITKNAGHTIRNNQIYGNYENAIDLKAARNVLIDSNCIYGTVGSGDGDLNGFNRNSLVTISKGNARAVRDVIIRNNILIDNANGMAIYDNFKVSHNVIIGNNRDFTGTDSGYTDANSFWGIRTQQDGKTGVLGIKNNIIGGHSTCQVALFVGSGATDFDIDGNIYFADGGANQLIDRIGGSETPYTFPAWQAHLAGLGHVAGKDANSVFFNTLAEVGFISVASKPQGPCTQHNFELLASSPAVAASVPLTTVTSTSNGTNVSVDDASWFSDGYGSAWVTGDKIYVNGEERTIQAINGNTLTVDSPVSVTIGDGVFAQDAGGLNVGLLNPVETTIVPCPGQIVNGDFNSAANWSSTADIDFTVTGGEAHVQGTTAVAPFNQLFQGGISLVAGRTYEVSYVARSASTTNNTLTAHIIQHAAPFASLGFFESENLTTTNATYAYTFTPTVSEANARFRFRFTEGEFYIDSVCLREAVEITAIPSSDVVTVAEGGAVNFTDLSTSSNGITEYLWDFGDGVTTTTQNPSHIYTAAGTYTVTLTVTGPDGTDSSTLTVVVEAVPVVVLTVPRATNHHVENSVGIVTQISAHPMVGFDLMPDTTLNLIAHYHISINVFTGLGQMTEEHGAMRVCYFNIDTGNYEIIDSAGTSLATGTDARFANYGAEFPLDPLFPGAARGQAYWDWAQAKYAAEAPRIAYAAQVWPTLYQAQFVRSQAL